jgi:hypothetical protein
VLRVLADISASQLRDTCGQDPGRVCREILQRTENRTLAEIADVLLGRTALTIVLILLAALIGNRLVGRAIDRALRSLSSGVVREGVGAVRRRAPDALLEPSQTSLRTEQRINALTSVLRSVAGFLILLFTCFLVLSELDVKVAPLLAGAGVVGVGLGFGSQSLVKDFLSGVFILVEDQFGVGDVVELDGLTSGTVEAVTLRTTRLLADDGTVWHVPNGAIVRVGNKSQAPRPAGAQRPPGEARDGPAVAGPAKGDEPPPSGAPSVPPARAATTADEPPPSGPPGAPPGKATKGDEPRPSGPPGEPPGEDATRRDEPPLAGPS